MFVIVTIKVWILIFHFMLSVHTLPHKGVWSFSVLLIERNETQSSKSSQMHMWSVRNVKRLSEIRTWKNGRHYRQQVPESRDIFGLILSPATIKYIMMDTYITAGLHDISAPPWTNCVQRTDTIQASVNTDARTANESITDHTDS